MKYRNGLDKYQINKNNTIYNAILKIEENKIRCVFVVDSNNVLVGILNDGDIRRWLIKNPKKSIDAETIFKNFSKKPFYFIYENEFSFDNLVNIFKNNNIDIVPIINANNILINYITRETFHTLILENKPLNAHTKPQLLSNQYSQEIISRPWGFYKSIILTKFTQAKTITVFPQQALSLQKHKRREEHWVIVYGQGKVILEDSSISVYVGKHVFIPKGCKHRIINTSKSKNLIFCEVQIGDYFGEDDIFRYEDKYNRK